MNGNSTVAALLKWLAANPYAWPVPLVLFLVWQQNSLLWALVERIDRLTVAVDLLRAALR